MVEILLILSTGASKIHEIFKFFEVALMQDLWLKPVVSPRPLWGSSGRLPERCKSAAPVQEEHNIIIQQ